MRVVAVLFGVLGVAGSGFIGARWMQDVGGKEEILKVAYELTKDGPNNQLKIDAEEAYKRSRTYKLLLAGAALGAAAVGLALARYRLVSGLLFLAAFALPMAIYQKAPLALFTGALVPAALFAFLVRPAAPPSKSKRRWDISDDDEDE